MFPKLFPEHRLRCSPVRGNSGFRVAPQDFKLYNCIFWNTMPTLGFNNHVYKGNLIWRIYLKTDHMLVLRTDWCMYRCNWYQLLYRFHHFDMDCCYMDWELKRKNNDEHEFICLWICQILAMVPLRRPLRYILCTHAQTNKKKKKNEKGVFFSHRRIK